MQFHLRHAADVTRDYHFGTSGNDMLRFLLTERARDLRLIHVVAAGAAAAEVRVGDFEQLQARDGLKRSRGCLRTFCAFERWQAS